jgi:hypothetical protein
MLYKSKLAAMSSVLVIFLTSLACAALQLDPSSTSTPEPTLTITTTPTNTPRPSPTLRPTGTPNVAATQHIEKRSAEIQSYYETGYLSSTEGQLVEVEDFRYEWAQLGWYNRLLFWESVDDFFLSAHFKWESALETSNVSGCGFIFGLQPNDDHYAVFLDRRQVYFLTTDHSLGYSKPVSPTRGTGRVKFEYPAEADFTLIVDDVYAYVLVDGELKGEYTLAKSRPQRGDLALTVLSGTNKDYGTRCEMTDLHLWIPGQ